MKTEVEPKISQISVSRSNKIFGRVASICPIYGSYSYRLRNPVGMEIRLVAFAGSVASRKLRTKFRVLISKHCLFFINFIKHFVTRNIHIAYDFKLFIFILHDISFYIFNLFLARDQYFSISKQNNMQVYNYFHNNHFDYLSF